MSYPYLLVNRPGTGTRKLRRKKSSAQLVISKASSSAKNTHPTAAFWDIGWVLALYCCTVSLGKFTKPYQIGILNSARRLPTLPLPSGIFCADWRNVRQTCHFIGISNSSTKFLALPFPSLKMVDTGTT